MLSRVLILILMSSWLAACGGGGGGGGTDEPEVPDVTAPAAPSAPDLAAGSDTGLSATDNITSDNTPTFTGSGGVAGNTVKVYANGAEVASGTVASNGSWSVTSSVLADNSYSITARYINAADVQSAASAALNPVIIDTVAPDAPNAPDLLAASDTGESDTDNVTSDNTPTFIGSGGVAGHTVTILANGSAVGSALVAGGGSWSVTTSPLADNSYSITARYTDLAGNQSLDSAALNPVVINTESLSRPSAPDLDAASDTGSSNSDNITSDNTPTFVGAGGAAGSTVTVYANDIEVGSGAVAGNGSWSVTTSVLADDSYSITIRFTATAGGQSDFSEALSPVVIDTEAPSAPVVTSATAEGISGTAAAGEVITLYDDGDTQVATTTVDGAGSWSIAADQLPDATGHGFAGSVTATDLAGNESIAIVVGPIDDPAPTLVSGRIVNGVVSSAEVCASVFESDWIHLDCTLSDDEGYFGFDIEPQAGPVLVEMVTGVSTLVTCSAPAGCGGVAFGEDYAPEPGTSLQLLIPGSQFAGELTISPLTNMAAVWAMKMPGTLNNDVAALSLTRVADLFGLPADFAAQLLPDITDSAEVADADGAAIEHALFAAGFSQLAATEMVSSAALVDQAALMFSLLGGQSWLESGQIVLDDLASSVDLSEWPELQDWLGSLDLSEWPELLELADEYNVINYAGFDSLLDAAEAVGAAAGLSVNFDALLTPWDGKRVTTLAGATGYDVATFNTAMDLINTIEGYRQAAAAAEAALDPVARHLAWLYADETSRAHTVGMIEVIMEALGFSLDAAICVPSRKNAQPCNVEPPYADLKFVSIGNYKLELRTTNNANATRFGQQVNIDIPATDIRDFLRNGTMTIPVSGTIKSGTSDTTLNIYLDLDITQNNLNGFKDLCNTCFGNANQLNPLLDALLADLHIAVTIRGGLTIVSKDTPTKTYSISNLNAGLVYNRRAANGDEDGAPLELKWNTGTRTNPAGEKLATIAGTPGFSLVLDDPFEFSLAYRNEHVGLPPVEVRLDAETEGTAPLLEALMNWIEANIDADTVLEDVDFESLLAELDFSLLAADGSASIEVLDPVAGTQSWYFTLADGGLNISTAPQAVPVLSVRLHGLAVYLYSGEMLVAVVNLGNEGEGLLLNPVDGSQQTFTALDDGDVLPFDSLLEFLTLLYEAYAPAPEVLP